MSFRSGCAYTALSRLLTQDYVVEVREDYEHDGKSTHLSKTDVGFRIVELRNREDKQSTR